jgi:exoribonuclease II
MINIFKTFSRREEADGGSTYTVTSEPLSKYSDMLSQRIARDLAEKLTEMWLEEHGTEMLKLISKKDVQKAVEKRLADKFWGEL